VLAPAASQAPAPPPSKQVSRLLRAAAFGAPVGVLLLIGLGIIVIEHFLGPARPILPPPTPPHASLPQDAVSQPDAAPDVEMSVTSRPDAKPAQTERPPAAVDQTDPYLAGLDKTQVELRIKRAELRLKYTEQHPDVVQVDRQLEQLRIERRRHLRQLEKN